MNACALRGTQYSIIYRINCRSNNESLLKIILQKLLETKEKARIVNQRAFMEPNKQSKREFEKQQITYSKVGNISAFMSYV